MSMGTIDVFPINTILEYANRSEHGLCPQLCGYIHPILTECDLDNPVSERSLRLAMDNLDGTILYQNIGLGVGVYAYSDGITANYYQIKPNSNNITGFMVDHTLVLSANADADVPSGLQTISVQGGKYQYSQTLDNIETSGSIIANASLDDVLAKTFIYCNEPFEQNGSSYSIGLRSPTFEDKTLITNQFNAPSTIGLVNFTYNQTMSAEYYWLHEDAEIRIYRYGSQPTSGEIGISVFYDNVIWSPSYGYDFGTSTDSIQRFNLNTDNIDVSDRSSVDEFHESNYTAINHNSYIYIAGGVDGSGYSNSVSRYETKTDTINPLYRTSFTSPRKDMGVAKSSTKMYFAGGESTIYYPTITIINFSDETTSNNNILTTAKSLICGLQTTTAMYFGGGKSASGYNSRIDKILFSHDTVIDSSKILTTERASATPYNTNIYGYFNGGKNSTGNLQSIVKYNYSTDLMTNAPQSYISLSDIGHTFQNKTDGFYFHGNIVEKYNFSTDTIIQTLSMPYRNNQTTAFTSFV